MPEEYFLAADGDYFYVSTIELPWAQAQYECLARRGHLAELDGMSILTLTTIKCFPTDLTCEY